MDTFAKIFILLSLIQGYFARRVLMDLRQRATCSIVHSLFDLDLVSASRPGVNYLYHANITNVVLRRRPLTESQIDAIQERKTTRFMRVLRLLENSSSSGLSNLRINQCYLDPTLANKSECRFARIYQISKLFYHDAKNLHKAHSNDGLIDSAFDLHVHWIELADFYLLHPDVTAVCPQPNNTDCAPVVFQPPAKAKNNRLVFRSICYLRVNKRGQIIPLKMEPSSIYEDLFKGDSGGKEVITRERWFRLTLTFSKTNGLKEEVNRLCSGRTESDFCFIEPMTSIYRKYMSFKGNSKANDTLLCRKLIIFSFDDFVLGKARPKLIDFWFSEKRTSRKLRRNTVLRFLNDIFPLLFEYIRLHKKEEIREAIRCLVYPLRISQTCNINNGIRIRKRCMLEQVINRLHAYVDIHGSNLKVVDTSLDLRKYLSFFELDVFDHIETETRAMMMDVNQLEMTDVNHKEMTDVNHKEMKDFNRYSGMAKSYEEPLSKHLKGLKKFFLQIYKYNTRVERNDVKYIQSRLDDQIASADIDSKRASLVLDTLINSVVLVNTTNPDEQKTKWGKVLLMALNPIGKLSKNPLVLEGFDTLRNTARNINALKVPCLLKELIRNVSNKVYHTKLAFFKNRELVRFVKENVILSNETIDQQEFVRNKALFLKGYDDYYPWTTKTDLAEIQALLADIVHVSCNAIEKAEKRISSNDNASDSDLFMYKKIVESLAMHCVTGRSDVNKMISAMRDTMIFLHEVFQTFLSFLRAKEVKFSMETAQALIKTNPSSNNPDSSHDKYQLYFTSLYARLMIYFEQVIIVDKLCDQREYEEFGVRPPDCSKYPPDMDIENILQRNNYLTTTKTVQIPTKPDPSRGGDDLGYLDLQQLIEGEEVAFQIPGREWLLKNKWITTKRSYSPLYLNTLLIFLPIVSDGLSDVMVSGRLVRKNILKQNDLTEYIVRPNPVLDSRYFEGKKAFSSCPTIENLVKNPYSICPRAGWELPMICIADEEDTTQGASGSILAKWKFMITGYEGKSLVLVNETMIRAQATILSKEENDIDKNAIKRDMTNTRQKHTNFIKRDMANSRQKHTNFIKREMVNTRQKHTNFMANTRQKHTNIVKRDTTDIGQNEKRNRIALRKIGAIFQPSAFVYSTFARNSSNTISMKNGEQRSKIAQVSDEKSCCDKNYYYSTKNNRCVVCPHEFNRYLKGYTCKKQ